MKRITEKDLVDAVSWGNDGPARVFLDKVPPETWTIATNGKILIAILGKIDGVTLEGEEFPGLVSARILIAEPIVSEEMNRQDFIKQLDSAPKPIKRECEKCKGEKKTKCFRCHGSGMAVITCDSCGHEHDCKCEECDGDGIVECDCARPSSVRECELRGMRFDADGLIRSLDLFDDEVVRVSTGSRRKEGPFEVNYITIIGSNWRIVTASRGFVEKNDANAGK